MVNKMFALKSFVSNLQKFESNKQITVNHKPVFNRILTYPPRKDLNKRLSKFLHSGFQFAGPSACFNTE